MSTVVRLYEIDAKDMLASYTQDFGLEKLRETFGEHWPPEAPRVGESVFCWIDDHGRYLSWLSLIKDQFDPTTAHMSRGVWPDRHGQNLGKIMRTFAEQWCRDNGCDSLQIAIFVANWQHLAKVMGDDYWDVEGVGFNPASFSFSHDVK